MEASSKKNEIRFNRRILTIFSVLSLVFIACIVTVTAFNISSVGGDLRRFSAGWKDDAGNVYEIADVRPDENGNPPVVSRQLPQGLSDDDCLCLVSYNVNVTVTVDGEVLYRFVGKENITGMGYGTAFHEIGLNSTLSGKTVQISQHNSNLESRSKRGHIEEIYIGPAVRYIYHEICKNIISIVASVLVLFFGIVFILISFVISDDERTPFDVAALGVSCVVIGAWYLCLTNAFQLISGHIYIARVLNRLLVMASGVPLMCFVNSLTQKKRKIYPLIEFWSTVLFVAVLFGLRLFFGIDMMTTFQRLLMVFILEVVVLSAVMCIEDRSYCKANGLTSNLNHYIGGIAIFCGCATADYLLYYFNTSIGNSYGTISSIGTFILLPIVLIQFIRWWTQNRAVIERERFTNRALHYALASDSPDENIRLMLKYMGEELKCKRAIVFEDAQNGRFHGRYAWFDESLGNRSIDLLYLPYKGVVEEALMSYVANNNRFVISDIEKYRDINLNIYNMLWAYNVETAVLSPLEVDGETTGLLVLLDMPVDMAEEASSVAGLMSYFLSQLILRRDDQKRMRMYRYNDSLSGANNRRAYEEFVKNRLDLSAPFGYLMCQLDDLERVSDTEGFEVGDVLVTDTVLLLCEVFGRDNVFRMVGSKFAAFGFETDEAYFMDDVQRFVDKARDRGISVSVGPVYCLNGAMDIMTVSKRANEIISSGGKHA